jgi:hypothetical protein
MTADRDRESLAGTPSHTTDRRNPPNRLGFANGGPASTPAAGVLQEAPVVEFAGQRRRYAGPEVSRPAAQIAVEFAGDPRQVLSPFPCRDLAHLPPELLQAPGVNAGARLPHVACDPTDRAFVPYEFLSWGFVGGAMSALPAESVQTLLRTLILRLSMMMRLYCHSAAGN